MAVDRRCVLGLLLGVAGSARAYVERPWDAGRETPPLSLSDLDGRLWSLPALQGRAVVLNFWATWCEPCREEMPSLQAMARRHQGDPMLVLTVNYREAEPAVRRFVERLPLALPVLLDRDGSVTRAWTSQVFPTTVLIDRDGRPRLQVVGGVDWAGEVARRWIHELLGSGSQRS